MMMELCVELITMARVTAGRSSQEMGEHATPCTLLDSPPAHLTSKERPSEVLWELERKKLTPQTLLV